MNSFYEVITPPTNEVITLAEAKDYCKIETTADDANIQRMINGVIDSCERITNRTLRPTVFRGNFDSLNCSRFEKFLFVDLIKSPISGVDSVKVWDGTDYADAEHTFKGSAGYPRILFKDASVLTSSQDDVAYSISVDFTAGYADGEVPSLLQNALLGHVLFLYENRGDVPAEGEVSISPEIEMQYRQYRIVGSF